LLTDTLRKDIQEELYLMLQAEVQSTKALIEATRCKFQKRLKEVEGGKRNRSGEATVSSTGLYHDPCSGAEHNCWTRMEISTLQGRAQP
jgi:hypothetical protein